MWSSVTAIMHHRQQTTYNNLRAVCVLTPHASMRHLDSVMTTREKICPVVLNGKTNTSRRNSKKIKSYHERNTTHTLMFAAFKSFLGSAAWNSLRKRVLLDPTWCNWAVHWGETVRIFSSGSQNFFFFFFFFTILSQNAAWCLAGQCWWVCDYDSQ